MQRAVSVVRLALSLIGRSQQKQYIIFYNTVVLARLLVGGHNDCLQNPTLNGSGTVDTFIPYEHDSFAADLSGEFFVDGMDAVYVGLIGPGALDDDRDALGDWFVPYDSQMELDVIGIDSALGGLDGGVEIRIDPNLTQRGSTTISPSGGGAGQRGSGCVERDFPADVFSFAQNCWLSPARISAGSTSLSRISRSAMRKCWPDCPSQTR
jgi:hypothetical protein